MSACQFDFNLSVEPGRLLTALRADFARFGGAIHGGEDPGGFGEFSLPTPLGNFSGTFEVTGADGGGCAFRISVDEKPMFLPCSAIEEHLGRRLQKAIART